MIMMRSILVSAITTTVWFFVLWFFFGRTVGDSSETFDLNKYSLNIDRDNVIRVHDKYLKYLRYDLNDVTGGLDKLTFFVELHLMDHGKKVDLRPSEDQIEARKLRQKHVLEESFLNPFSSP